MTQDELDNIFHRLKTYYEGRKDMLQPDVCNLFNEVERLRGTLRTLSTEVDRILKDYDY